LIFENLDFLEYRVCNRVFLANEPAGEERTRKNLIRLGVNQNHAYTWSTTRKGDWAVAQSPILGTTITLQRLKKRDYVSLTELHLQLNPSLCPPPSA